MAGGKQQAAIAANKKEKVKAQAQAQAQTKGQADGGKGKKGEDGYEAQGEAQAKHEEEGGEEKDEAKRKTRASGRKRAHGDEGSENEDGDEGWVESEGGNEDEHQGKKLKREQSKSNADSESNSNAHADSNDGATGAHAAIHYLLSDEAWSLAYPPLEQGKGEVDLPPGAQAKTPPPRADASSKSKSKSKSEGEGDGDGDGGGGAPRISYPSPYARTLTPFQTLLCAALLSKPLSHRLGLRAIATLLNPPFSLRTPAALEEAGEQGRRSALWEARTQHKEKTAGQLGDVVRGVREGCAGEKAAAGKEGEREQGAVDLAGVKAAVDGVAAEGKRKRKGNDADADADADARSEAVQKVTAALTGIKGIGAGACDIFLRRIQLDWAALYPFADARSLDFARQVVLLGKGGEGGRDDAGLLAGAEELRDVMRSALGEGGGGGEKGGEKEREQFVKLLDVLIGLGLEKQLDAVKDKVKA